MSVRPTVIIAVGDELLGGFTQDTNSAFLARAAFAAGWPVRRIEVVGDRLEEISAAIGRALGDHGVSRVVLCGGIGPTPDDRTLEAVAAALDRPLELDEGAMAHIAGIVSRMHAAGWVASPEVTEANRRAALLPRGAEAVTNRRGMSPAVAVEVGDDRWLFVLPGVPREFTAIVEEELLPRWFAGRAAPAVAEVAFEGIPESEFHASLLALAAEFPEVEAGSYPQPDRRHVIIRLRGGDPARVDAAAARIRELMDAARRA